ncbi:MAG TPA: helix-turn-helix transcriptional regulator [Gemmatimonas sp.]|uniref:helix-turn-helix domain-containing protein n=1 Tax=Gemmatimonas sp. TaxID=1962908 RepID=UPI002ED838CE
MPRITAELPTPDVLREFGDRIQGYRLQQNLRVIDIARLSGLPTRTINRLEAGENSTLETVVRVLRALGRLEALETFLPPPVLSPIQLAAMSGQVRQRASRPRKSPESPDRE